MRYVCHPKILHKNCLHLNILTPKRNWRQCLCKILGRRTKRALWYVMVFSGVVNWFLVYLVTFLTYLQGLAIETCYLEEFVHSLLNTTVLIRVLYWRIWRKNVNFFQSNLRPLPFDCGFIDRDCFHSRWRDRKLCSWSFVSKQTRSYYYRTKRSKKNLEVMTIFYLFIYLFIAKLLMKFAQTAFFRGIIMSTFMLQA